MKKALLVVCVTAILLGTAVFTHPAFASSQSGTGSTASGADCLQPPTDVDHATLSDADLDKYGLPRYQAGKDKEKWKSLVRSSKQRICGGTPTQFSNSLAAGLGSNNRLTPSCTAQELGQSPSIWTGNISVNSATDGACTQAYQYIEADAVFFVPCIKPGSATGAESSWVGLGGLNNNNLVQAGTHSEVSYNIFGSPNYTYYAWTQNYADSKYETMRFGVNCNDRMQVYVYDFGDMYLGDANNGQYNTYTSNHNASTNTAEWIVERPSNGSGPEPLANFQSETFYGMGTTGYQGGAQVYASPAAFDHDYQNMDGRTSIGCLCYNTTYGPPNYSNTITWNHQ